MISSPATARPRRRPLVSLATTATFAVLAALASATPVVGAAARGDVVMPKPAEARWGEGRLAITPAVTFALRGPDDGRVQGALARMARAWEQRTGVVFARTPQGALATAAADAPASVTLAWSALATPVPAADENESYTLEITSDRVRLEAPTSTGVLRGLATLTLMLQSDHDGWFLAEASVKDSPRFAWRGLLIDPARHWIPVDGVKRTLDGMALVKLNVLHFHLTDDQGFRIESKRYPKLQELGSDGNYYTQDQIRDLIAYAAARGIRVVPEFDVPGHATTWAVAFPELASAPGPYAIARTWGVHDVVLDPTNENLYPVLDGFFGEMAALFPDAYVHIGGDENNGRQWTANAHIREFIRTHGLKDNAALQAYFNRRLQEIVTKHGKKMIGWDEILHPDLPPGTVIQSWRGANDMANATRMNFAAILSRGNYLDHMLTAAEHYANDPVPAVPLTPEQQRLILGGEACIWGEWTTADTLDARTWPRAGAIAERLWSPKNVTDVDDMYRRLEWLNDRLEDAGLRHRANRAVMLRRLAGTSSPAVPQQLELLADLYRGGGLHVRSAAMPRTTQFNPLDEFADCADADSRVDRTFANDVRTLVFAPGDRTPAQLQALADRLATWQALGEQLAAGQLAPASPRVVALAPLGRTLADAARIGRDALGDLGHGGATASETRQRLDTLATLGRPQLGVALGIVTPLRVLVAAAGQEQARIHLKPEEWSAEVERLAAPPAARK